MYGGEGEGECVDIKCLSLHAFSKTMFDLLSSNPPAGSSHRDGGSRQKVDGLINIHES